MRSTITVPNLPISHNKHSQKPQKRCDEYEKHTKSIQNQQKPPMIYETHKKQTVQTVQTTEMNLRRQRLHHDRCSLRCTDRRSHWDWPGHFALISSCHEVPGHAGGPNRGHDRSCDTGQVRRPPEDLAVQFGSLRLLVELQPVVRVRIPLQLPRFVRVKADCVGEGFAAGI